MKRRARAKAKKPDDKSEEKKQFIEKRDLYMIVGAIVALIVIFMVASAIFKQIGKIEYGGLTFVKDKFGDIPIYRHGYHFTTASGEIINYNFYVRVNPKENNVPVSGEIVFPGEGGLVFLGINGTGLGKCAQSNIALAGLSEFLKNNQFDVKVGTPDKQEARNLSVTHVTCDLDETKMTVMVAAGDETKIEKSGNCYDIRVANCEILQALEKFEVQALVDAKNRRLAEG